MLFQYRIHAGNCGHFGIAPESCDREIREFCRELARPVTFFDLCSPLFFFGAEIGEFFRVHFKTPSWSL